MGELSAKEAQEIGVDGIGLSIARKVGQSIKRSVTESNIWVQFVELLAGEIGCNSIVDEGTTFWFTVTCGRPSPDSIVKFSPPEMTLSKSLGLVLHPRELKDQGREESQAKVHIDGMVVLLVEDNWGQQMVMKKRLETIGCSVVTAVNGRDALGILKKGESTVDIIFMDMQMPLLV